VSSRLNNFPEYILFYGGLTVVEYPPIVNKAINPSANNIGAVYRNDPP
jgi:hypothetical protein